MSRPKIDMSFGKFEHKHWEKNYGKLLWNLSVRNYMSILTHNYLPTTSPERKHYLASLVAIGEQYFIYHNYNKDKNRFELIDTKESMQHLRKQFKRIAEKKQCKELHKKYNVDTNNFSRRSKEITENLVPETIRSIMLRLTTTTNEKDSKLKQSMAESSQT